MFTKKIQSTTARPLAFFFIVFFIVTATVLLIFRQLGNWLVASDPPPEHLDVICTFAGDSRRVVYSKEFMHRYPQAHWFLSDYKDGHGRLLQKSNFDMSRVTIIDTCTNTVSEIVSLRHWLDRCRPVPPSGGGAAVRINVGLVSSPYHMRRIRIMAERCLNRPDVRWYLISVPLEEYQWDHNTFRYWWRSGNVASITLLELLKIVYFLLTG